MRSSLSVGQKVGSVGTESLASSHGTVLMSVSDKQAVLDELTPWIGVFHVDVWRNYSIFQCEDCLDDTRQACRTF